MPLADALAQLAADEDSAFEHLAGLLAVDTSCPPGRNYAALTGWAAARLTPLG